MRKRIIPVVVLALCLAVLAGVVIAVSQRPAPPSGVTLENFRRLRIWMSKKQVDRILGAGGEAALIHGGHHAQPGYCYQRKGSDIQMTVQINDEGEMCAANYYEGGTIVYLRPEPSFLGRWWWSLGLVK
jgi:hypothetical protein